MTSSPKPTHTGALGAIIALTMLVGCDHATKYVAQAELKARPAQALIEPILHLRYVENTDMAFNLLRFLPEGVRFWLLIGQGTLVIACLAALLAAGKVSGWARVGLLMVLAGGIGNYADRLARGYVVDFIHVIHWPVFNVADVLITAGLGLLVLRGFPLKPTEA